MKHKVITVSVLLAALAFGGAAMADEDLSVAATPVPHAEILEYIQPTLQEAGVNLEIKVFTDYVQPNVQVEDEQIDANFFQHIPYLNTFNEEHGSHLVKVGAVHIEPFGAYSASIDNIDELPDGALVAIPNDPSNAARALLLIQKQGLIELEDPDDLLATSRDIVDNPKNLQFKELEAATLPRALVDVDMALINTNYALEAGLNPTADALFIEDADSPYVNVIAVKAGNEDDPAVRKLVDALHSDAVREFIETEYEGAIVPVF